MRLLIHDYAGHPFQAQLSRALARRGHDVLHLHAAFFQTPKGRLSRAEDDPPGFAVEGLELGAPFAKYRFFKRRAQERAFGRILCARAKSFAPQLVICANVPLDPLALISDWCAARLIPFVFWVQDIYSHAIDRHLRAALGPAGAIIGGHYRRLERRVARSSAALVLITDDFRAEIAGWGIAAERLTVVENWAPLDELPALPRANPWSHRHGLDERIVLLYAGTLGLKHNPALLSALAERFRDDPRVVVVVASEGPGAEWLAERKAADRLDNLRLLGFQPYAELPAMLATGDVLVAILEPEAGVYSVPSKVLSYLCAGRPLLAAIPAANLAARLIGREAAGLVADPADIGAFAAAAEQLVQDANLRSRFGNNALDYARRNFNIDRIADRFEAVMTRAIQEKGTCHG